MAIHPLIVDLLSLLYFHALVCSLWLIVKVDFDIEEKGRKCKMIDSLFAKLFVVVQHRYSCCTIFMVRFMQMLNFFFYFRLFDRLIQSYFSYERIINTVIDTHTITTSFSFKVKE